MRYIGILILVLLNTIIYAQKGNESSKISWSEFEQLEKNGLYKNALQLLTPLLDKAIQENNIGEFQKALNFHILTAENALLENDEKHTLLHQLERKIDQTKVPLNNLGHLFLAHLYEQYSYQWGLYDDFKLTINATTLTNREQAINYHYQKALIHFEELIHYPAKDILAIMYESDSLISTFKPTLLDYGITEIDNRFQKNTYNDTSLFYQTETLLHYPKDTLLSIYYTLENFHWKNNNHYAYVETVLQRINAIASRTSETSSEQENHFSPKRNTHFTGSKREINYSWLYEKLKNTPAVMKVQLLDAKNLHQQGETYDWKTNSKVKNKNAEAVKLIETSCATYPNSLYYHESQESLFEIKNTSLEAKIEGKILPNTHNLLSVTYKNIDSIYLTIYHIDKVINDTSKNFFKDFKLKPLFKQILHLDKNGLYNKHTKDFILPAWKQTGKFLVLISENEKTEQRLTAEDSIDSHLKFSHLTIDIHEHTAIYKSENNKGILHVRDIMNGKPIAKARVSIKKGYNQIEKETHYITDKNGECIFPLENNYSNWKVIFNNDSIESSMYGNNHDQRNEDETHFQTLTDRAIYRPGQTVYYKIYAYKIKNHLKSVVKNEKLKIYFKDQNQKEILISENEFITNDFGTYSSSFTLPKNGFSLGQIHIMIGSENNNSGGFSSFRVEEYKRPTFYVENKFTKNEYQSGESITVKGKAMSYADYPIPNATVKISIRSSSYDWRGNQSPFHMDTLLKTNSIGEYTFTFTTPNHLKYGVNITLNSIVTNQTGETQENEISKFIGNKKKEWAVYVPEEILTSKNNTIYFTLSDSVKEKIPFQLIVLKENNNSREISQTFSEQEFQGFKQLEFNKLLPNCIYYQNQLKPNFDTILSTKKYINDSISLQKITNNLPGKYQLTYYYINNHNDTILETKEIKSIDLTNDEKQHNEALWIKPYMFLPNISETLPILIGTNYSNQIAHYRIYRDNLLLESKTIKIDKRKTIYYTIKKEDIDGISIEVYFVKQGDFYSKSTLVDISQRDKNIKLNIETKRTYLSPGQKEKWVISQQSALNNDKELAITMTDASLDKIVPSNWYFYNYTSNPNYDKWNLNSSNNNRNVLGNWTNHSFSYYRNNKLVKTTVMKYEDKLSRSEISYMAVRSMKDLDDSSDIWGNVNQELSTSNKPSTLRTNFNETAFFYPNLYADKDGKFSFEFTLPDALTTWKFIAFAHDKEMNTGQLTEYFIAQKELMVQPNAPRFLRAGDVFEFSANVVNITEKNLPIDVTLEWFNPITNEVMPSVFGILEPQKIILTGKQSKAVSWKLHIPESGLDLIAYRIKASSEYFTDSEEKAIPVLNNRVLVTEALPITIEEKGNYTFELEKLSKGTSNTKQHENLVFDFTTNPIWSVVKTLPSASNVTYQSSDALFNAYFINALGTKVIASNPAIKQMIANWNISSSELNTSSLATSVDLSETPWVNIAKTESEQRKEIAYFLQENNLNNQQKTYLDQLFQQRNSDGAWPWFAGGISSEYITNNLLFGFALLNEKPTELTTTLIYLNTYYTNEYNKYKKPNPLDDNWLSQQDIQWLYIHSTFKLEPNAFTLYLEKKIEKNWTKLSLKQQAMLGMYLVKVGKRELAHKISASIQNRATKRKNTGTYWNEKYYSNSEAIETQAYILQFFTALGLEKSVLNSIQLSLLNKKRGQLWENSTTTAQVVHSLLQVPNTEFSTNNTAKIYVGKELIDKSVNEVGELSQTWNKKEITPALGQVEITQNSENTSFGALTYTYTENIQNVTNSNKGLGIIKEIYLIEGEKEILITPSTKLKVGDQLRIYLKVNSDRALDYVHLKDLKATSMENINQLSTYGYGKNVSYYTTPYDNRTSFFIEHLPKGKSSVSYDVRLTHKGTHSIGYALIECLYAPEFRGNTSGEKIIVGE